MKRHEIITVQIMTKVSVKWWCVLSLLLINTLTSAQFGEPDSQSPPFWLNEISDSNRVTPANRIKPGSEDNVYPIDHDNVRHFHHLNLVQGQQVYSNNSGHM